MSDETDKIETQCIQCGRRYQAARASIGQKAQCACGATFEVRPAEPTVTGPPKCFRHSEVPSVQACCQCGQPVCQTCAFPSANGTVRCPVCVSSPMARLQGAVTVPPVAAPPLSQMCRRHPEQQAMHLCARCRAPICSTCDFVFPGNLHLCPTCATTPETGLGKRKGRVVAALSLAVWSTLSLVFMLVSAREARTAESQQSIGVAFAFLGFVPAMVGMALGLSCFEKRMHSPPLIWVGAIWNILVVAVFLLLVVIGLTVAG